MFTRFSGLAVVVGLTAISFSFGSSGCKEDEPGTGGSGGGGGQAQDPPVILPPNANGQSCENGSTCDDQASVDEYSQCIITTCDPEYKQCFGADYLNGNYAGPCADLMNCAKTCDDCDQTCLKACSDQSLAGACQDCIVGPIFDCVVEALTSGTCDIPCGPSSSGGVCDDLEACCNMLADPTDKADCLNTHSQVQIGGDMACGSALGIYQASEQCP